MKTYSNVVFKYFKTHRSNYYSFLRYTAMSADKPDIQSDMLRCQCTYWEISQLQRESLSLRNFQHPRKEIPIFRNLPHFLISPTFTNFTLSEKKSLTFRMILLTFREEHCHYQIWNFLHSETPSYKANSYQILPYIL